MNNLLLILGILALSNGNVSLFDSKNKSKKSMESTSGNRAPKVKILMLKLKEENQMAATPPAIMTIYLNLI